LFRRDAETSTRDARYPTVSVVLAGDKTVQKKTVPIIICTEASI